MIDLLGLQSLINLSLGAENSSSAGENATDLDSSFGLLLESNNKEGLILADLDIKNLDLHGLNQSAFNIDDLDLDLDLDEEDLLPLSAYALPVVINEIKATGILDSSYGLLSAEALNEVSVETINSSADLLEKLVLHDLNKALELEISKLDKEISKIDIHEEPMINELLEQVDVLEDLESLSKDIKGILEQRVKEVSFDEAIAQGVEKALERSLARDLERTIILHEEPKLSFNVNEVMDVDPKESLEKLNNMLELSRELLQNKIEAKLEDLSSFDQKPLYQIALKLSEAVEEISLPSRMLEKLSSLAQEKTLAMDLSGSQNTKLPKPENKSHQHIEIEGVDSLSYVDAAKSVEKTSSAEQRFGEPVEKLELQLERLKTEITKAENKVKVLKVAKHYQDASVATSVEAPLESKESIFISDLASKANSMRKASEAYSVRELVDALPEKISKLARSPKQELSLNLNPEELGKVTIKIVRTNAELTVKVLVNNDQALNLLKQEFSNLGSKMGTLMADRGIEFREIQVSKAGDGAGLGSGTEANRGQGSHNEARQEQRNRLLDRIPDWVQDRNSSNRPSFNSELLGRIRSE